MNNYIRTLQYCGATVYESKKFGSYQGDWWAFVEYNDERFFVHGTFGSCPVCDSFQSETDSSFFYDDPFDVLNGKEVYNDYGIRRTLTDDEKIELSGIIKMIGHRYLDDPLTYDQAIKIASVDLDWDEDAQDMVDFINECKGKYAKSN